MSEITKQLVQCTHATCEHTWETKSQRQYLTCPNCLRKVKLGAARQKAQEVQDGDADDE